MNYYSKYLKYKNKYYELKNQLSGQYHNIGLRSDGSVCTFGDKDYNQFDNNPEFKDFVLIACGDYHNIGLRINNSIITWG
jgi:alpha-tubulin suppressor-like RCC1 family protein